MVGHNKAVKKGGGSHSSNYFCIHCDETRDASHVPEPDLCTTMCQLIHEERDDWFCYHNPMLTSINLNEMEHRVNVLEQMISTQDHLLLDNDIVDNRICFSAECADNILNDINSVYYDVNLNSSRITVIKFNNMINNELRLRGQNILETLEEKRCRLIIIMKIEYELVMLKKQLAHASPNVRSFYYMITSIPYMMHG